MQAKILAWITFDIFGGIWVIGNVLTNVHNILNILASLVLIVYFALRSYIRLKRDAIALRKETFEQMQRELNASKE